jgi:oligoendopeptidase F
MVTTTIVPPRQQIPVEQTWNAESVFADRAAWQAEYEAVKVEIPSIATYAGKIGSDPEFLIEYLDVSSKIRRRIHKLYFYSSMSSAVDSSDASAKGMVGQAMGLMGLYGKFSAFERPELLAAGKERVLGWVNTQPQLEIYAKAFDDLFRQQATVRSAEVEEVLGMLNEPFGAARQSAGELTNTDLTFADAHDSKGGTFNVTQSSLRIALGHPDRELRRTAWQNYMDSHLAFKNTLANMYSASVKSSTMMMRVRGYESVLQMQLFPHNLPLSVFHNLIDTYKKNLPTWHRYWEVRRKALGVEKIYPYDIWAPIVEEEPAVSFEQAVEYIAAGMQPLGEEYVEILRRGCLEERWVDRSVNQGKRQGAFSGGSYDTHPFIMMSFDDQLSGMSTLAHELGHSLHSYLCRREQPEVYAGYSMFVAEVASNFNQAMTRAHLFEKEQDRVFQLALIQEAMDNFHRYFFIMPTLARFELEIHERVAAGKPVNADIMNGIMSDFFAEGYGSTMTDDRERTGITWATFGHLYVPYYTFQYATGISAAHALADKIQTGDESAAQNYLQFLSAGSSLYPMDALKLAGIDMTTPEAVEKTFAVLSTIVDRLETLTSA